MFHRHFILEENFEKRSGQAEISLVGIFWAKYFNCSLQNVIYSILFYFSLVLVFGVEMFYFCDIRYLYPHLKYTIYKKTEIIRKWVIWNTWIKPMFFFYSFFANIYEILYFSSLICIQTTSQTLQPHPEQNLSSSHSPFYFSKAIWPAGIWTYCLIPL